MTHLGISKVNNVYNINIIKTNITIIQSKIIKLKDTIIEYNSNKYLFSTVDYNYLYHTVYSNKQKNIFIYLI